MTTMTKAARLFNKGNIESVHYKDNKIKMHARKKEVSHMFVRVGSCWSTSKRDHGCSFGQGKNLWKRLKVKIVGPVSLNSCFFPDSLIHSRLDLKLFSRQRVGTVMHWVLPKSTRRKQDPKAVPA